MRQIDSATLVRSIRAKLVARTIQGAYDSQPMLFSSGRVTYSCQGCDMPFLGEVSLGYQSGSGDVHWFHPACDAIRKRVSLADQYPAGPQFDSPAISSSDHT